MTSEYWPDTVHFAPAIVSDPNSTSLYTPSGQSTYSDYTQHGQNQSSLYTVPSGGVARTSTTSSSLQYALRPQASLAHSGSGSSLSLSALSTMNMSSSLNSNSMASSLSPLSPHASHSHYASHGTTEQGQHNYTGASHEQTQTSVHSHVYPESNFSTPTTTANLAFRNNTPRNGSFDVNAEPPMYSFDSPPGYHHPYDAHPHHTSRETRVSGSPARPPSLRVQTQTTGRAGYAAAHTPTSRHAARTVKTEPDEDSRSPLERSPDFGAGPGGRLAAQFVHEHPYPYSFASTTSTNKLGRSGSPFSPHEIQQEHDASFGVGVGKETNANFGQDPHSQSVSLHGPHSLTAPLRAVNASAPMRACMGVFRLDPFAQLNGVPLRCGFVSSSFSSDTGEFSGSGKRGKRKRRGKKKLMKGRKRIKGGGEYEFEKENEEDLEEDEDEEMTDQMETPTWDGFPAGPLAREPVLLEFQLYFEGMEVEDTYENDVESQDGGGGGGPEEEEMDGFYKDAAKLSVPVPSNTYPNPGQTKAQVEARQKVEQSINAPPPSSRRYDYESEYTHVGRATGLDYKPESDLAHVHRRHEHEHDLIGSAGERTRTRTRSRMADAEVFEEYLDIDLNTDLDMEVEADGWGSGSQEASPTSPYAQNTNANGTQTYRTGSSPTSSGTPTRTLSAAAPVGTAGFTSSDYNGTAAHFSGRPRYFDSAGYVRLSDAMQFPSSSSLYLSGSGSGSGSGQSNVNGASAMKTNSAPSSGSNSGSPSPFLNFSNVTGNGNGNRNGNPGPGGTRSGIAAGNASNLQQLRTQAALRAVSASASARSQNTNTVQRGYADSGSAQRSGDGQGAGAGAGGGGGGVSFTPTPASLVAEMQTGLLAHGGGRHQHLQQQQGRMYASSGSGSGSGSGIHAPQGHSHGPTLTGPGIGTYNPFSHQSMNSSGAAPAPAYAYPDYAPSGPGSVSGSGSGAGSGSGSIGGAFGHFHAPHEPGGMPVGLQTFERRWGDVQRVQG